MTAHKREDPISKRLLNLEEESEWQVVAVAISNKIAGIV
jgi:hypothetical protein